MKDKVKKVLYIGLALFLIGLSCVLWLFSGRQNKKESVQSKYIAAVCQAVKNMDFTIREPMMDIMPEEDRLYKEAYLKALRNEMPIIEGLTFSGYYKDMRGAGIEFEKLLENKSVNSYPYLLYYDDLDGDGKPELGIKQESFYIFDYKLGESEIRAWYITSGFGKMLGAGQIWCHYEYDGNYGTDIYDEYIVLNDDNKWEALKLRHGTSTSRNYYRNYYSVETP
ncbi:MAG: hypothetical protein K2M91_15975, partial [Lachnospiraceae bacterium]|nr:hypothetical protein [Lachnospiraceae bacterium]